MAACFELEELSKSEGCSIKLKKTDSGFSGEIPHIHFSEFSKCDTAAKRAGANEDAAFPPRVSVSVKIEANDAGRGLARGCF